MERNRVLRIAEPASNWNEAFLIGTGRLGAMIHGGESIEHLQLNEDSLWSGGPRERANPDAGRTLPQVRHPLRAGRVSEAEQFSLQRKPPPWAVVRGRLCR